MAAGRHEEFKRQRAYVMQWSHKLFTSLKGNAPWAKIYTVGDRLSEGLDELLDIILAEPQVNPLAEMLNRGERRGAALMRQRILELIVDDHPEAAALVRKIRSEDPWGPPAPAGPKPK